MVESLLCIPTLHSGLLGQSFDRSYCPHVIGKLDNYSQLDDGRSALERRAVGGDVITRAMGEGAIEGTADDYLVRSNFNSKHHTHLPFGTDFKYSRFDALAAPPRQLSGINSAGKCVPAHLRWNVTHALNRGGLWPGLNFAGHDFKRQPLYLTNPTQCRRACEKHFGCVAFSFITVSKPPDPKRRCWMKHRGFERGAFLSDHVTSGILPKAAAKKSRIRAQQQQKKADHVISGILPKAAAKKSRIRAQQQQKKAFGLRAPAK